MVDKSEVLKFVAESSVVAGALYVYIKSRSAEIRQRSLLEYTIKAIIHAPHELMNMLSRNEVTEEDKDFLDVTRDDLLVKFTGFVEGRVQSKAPFTSYIDKLKEVVLSKLIMEPIYSNSSIADPKDFLIKVKQKPEFELIDETNLAKLMVRKTSTADVDDGLVFIGATRKIAKSDLCVRVIYHIVYSLKLIMSILRIGLNLRGVKIGRQTTEFGLLINQTLTLFGKMVYDKRNKTLTMEKPYFYLQNKQQLMRKIADKIRRLNLFKFGSAVFGMIFLFLAIRRAIRLGTSLRSYLVQLRTEFNLDKLKGLKSIFTNGFICVLCKTNAKNVILKPCLHICVCKSCFTEKKLQSCPTCQKPIKDIVNVFVA